MPIIRAARLFLSNPRHEKQGTANRSASSLAGELQRAGGFAKDTTPFSEFLWADFLRRRVKRKTVETHFEQAVEQALELAKNEEASYLPGWCGPVLED